jgi:tetrahydromethanopterin S-methyltransferase subunit G
MDINAITDQLDRIEAKVDFLLNALIEDEVPDLEDIDLDGLAVGGERDQNQVL